MLTAESKSQPNQFSLFYTTIPLKLDPLYVVNGWKCFIDFLQPVLSHENSGKR